MNACGLYIFFETKPLAETGKSIWRAKKIKINKSILRTNQIYRKGARGFQPSLTTQRNSNQVHGMNVYSTSNLGMTIQRRRQSTTCVCTTCPMLQPRGHNAILTGLLARRTCGVQKRPYESPAAATARQTYPASRAPAVWKFFVAGVTRKQRVDNRRGEGGHGRLLKRATEREIGSLHYTPKNKAVTSCVAQQRR